MLKKLKMHINNVFDIMMILSYDFLKATKCIFYKITMSQNASRK